MKNGFVSKINNEERLYEITSMDEEIFELNFVECQTERLTIGDVIEFEAYSSEKYGKCALNPIRLNNKYFDELKAKIGTSEYVTGYVYERKEFGFNVSYNGYNCYLPIGDTHIGSYESLDESEILNKFHRFLVKEEKEGYIVLSRRKFLKNEIQELINLEIEKLRIGEVFSGKIYSTVGYGVFITYKYSTGLLHVKNFLSNYDSSITKATKKQIERAIEKSFKKGSNIIVSVNEKIGDKYDLTWDMQIPENQEIYSNFIQSLDDI
jgi:ribosomal protein S1